MRPSAFTPEARAGARGGRVWLAQTADGLVVAGRIDGRFASLARDAGAISNGEHIAITLSLADPAPMPPIGWGNQFGPVVLARAEDCAKTDLLEDDDQAVADCKAWFDEQVTYRGAVGKLFRRVWRLAPAGVVETSAAPTFAALPPPAAEALEALAPDDVAPTIRFSAYGGDAYDFETLIPWRALPPSPSLEVAVVRIAVEAIVPSPETRAKPVETAPLAAVALSPAKRWRIGRCGSPLVMEDAWGDSKPAWFKPRSTAEIDETFLIENDVEAGRFAPGGLSPVATRMRHFAADISPGLTVCGPPLAIVRDGGVTFEDRFSISPKLSARPVTGGWLIADGPHPGLPDRAGDEGCPACPVVNLQILFIPAGDGAASVAFRDAIALEGVDGGRMVISDDLRRVQVWRRETEEAGPPPRWSRTQYCYEPARREFAECGKDQNASTPAGPPPPEAADPRL